MSQEEVSAIVLSVIGRATRNALRDAQMSFEESDEDRRRKAEEGRRRTRLLSELQQALDEDAPSSHLASN